MTAHEDAELLDWLLNAAGCVTVVRKWQVHSGDFLRSLATAALRADKENFLIIRPALLAIKAKYPVWDEPFREPGRHFFEGDQNARDLAEKAANPGTGADPNSGENQAKAIERRIRKKGVL